MNGTGHSEGTKRVAAGATEAKLKTAAAGATCGYSAQPDSIDGDETVNTGKIPEQCLDTTQVATTLLSDIAAENDVSHSLDPVILERLNH